MTEKEWVEGIAVAARSFLSSYDEFWPEYPDAIGDWLQSLITAVDDYPDEGDAPAEPILPPYEP